MAASEDKRKYGVGVAVAVLLVAAVALGYQLVGGRENGAAGPVAKTAYYTDDNGKTFFKDDVNKIPPFDHNGKQALRCDVFEAGGKQFVGLVYRFTEAGKRDMAAYNPSKDADGSTRKSIEERSLQVKPVAAADKAWDIADETTVMRLQSQVKDPSGKPAKLVQP